MVHKFLSFFLKKKMERELKRFAVVEDAFKKIKSNTVKKKYKFFRVFQILMTS